MIDLEKVEAAASGQWGYILARLAPDLGDALARPKKHVPCPVHGGKDGFRLFDDYERTGGGICNSCGPKAGGIALLMWVNGWTFKEALEAVAGVLGLDDARARDFTPQRRVETQPRIDMEAARKKREAIKRVWRQSVPPSHKEAEPLRLYMLRRRLEYRALPPTIRLHPSLAYYNDAREKVGEWPAMVAAIYDRGGKPLSLHRTWLDRHGFKADVTKPKKVMSVPDDLSIAGGSVWLAKGVDKSPVVAITEGIETGLAVQTVTRVPTVAAISAIGMEKWQPFDATRLVLIFADKDPERRTADGIVRPGEQAAKRLHANLWAKGVKARAYLPKQEAGEKGVDWADVLFSIGPAGFPALDLRQLAKEAMAA